MMQQHALRSAGASTGGIGLVARLKQAEQTGSTSATVRVYQAVLAGWSAAATASPGLQHGLLEQILPCGDLLRLLMEHLKSPALELCALLPYPCLLSLRVP